MADITSISTKATLNTKTREIENKIPDTTGFIATTGFNRLTNIRFDARMKEATESLASKDRVTTALDIADRNRENIQKTLDYISQNYLVLKPLFKSFTTPTGSDRILAHKSKGLWEESIKPPATLDNSLTPKLIFTENGIIAIEFKGSCLKQDKATFTDKNMVNLLIVYELDTWTRDLNTRNHFPQITL